MDHPQRSPAGPRPATTPSLFLMAFPLVLLGLPALLGVPPAVEERPPWQVTTAERPLQDRRFELRVTLDGEHPWEPPAALDEWRRRRGEVRRRILVAAGLWPMLPKPPLKAVIHGRIERSGYTVEKVYFQSFPGWYVTGNLYRPAGGGGPKPGVLCPHGHWPNGRFYERSEEDARRQIAGGKESTLAGAMYPLQARCAQLARLGCVVFHYDMVGYGDSTLVAHRAGFGDLDAELWGQSFFGLQTFNSIRALDFLAGLPDVDPRRIGVTGASGGGTQTFILCAIDDRPATSFPAVMVSSKMQGGCVCENASHLRVGTTNVEFAALAAPRPQAMTGANDWTIEIETNGLPQLKKVYGFYGVPDRVEAWCFPRFEHNYNQVSRELMYNWFDLYLELGWPVPVREEPFVPILPRLLSVYDAEHPRPPAHAGVADVRAWWKAKAREQIAALVPKSRGEAGRFREVLGGALETLLAAEGLRGRPIRTVPRGRR